MADAGSPDRALVHAQRRRQRDDERLRGRRGRHHQAGARARARRQSRARVGGAVRDHRSAKKRSTGTPANVPMRGIEPTALQVRDEVTIVDGRMFQFGTNEVDRRPRRQPAVRRRRPRVASSRRAELTLEGGRHLRGRRPRRRNRDLVRRARCSRAPTGAATPISRCWRGSTRRRRSTRSRTG